MHIRRLRLVNFRNYEAAELLPASGVTVLYGENAQGKTNLIEAIHLCCLGRSHRTSRDAELIRFAQSMAQVSVEVQKRSGPHDVTIRINSMEKRKKQVKVNGSPVQRIGELMGHVNAVLFSPEDLRLVKDGPDGRRRFMDMEISQMQPTYFYALQRYTRALSQRNELLRALFLKRDASLMETLFAWDEMLAEQGGIIAQRRMAYLDMLSAYAQEIHGAISGEREKLSLAYVGRAHDAGDIASLLRAAQREDMQRRTTSVGPHRDDIRILLNGRDARCYASQGQQRTAALSIKLAEIEVLRAETGESPILLLDDVMSELDIGRRNMMGKRTMDVQTLITCTHLSDLGGASYDKAVHIAEGHILSDQESGHQTENKDQNTPL